MRRRIGALSLVVSFLALSAPAQEQHGSIQGVVKDGSGGVMPGATVELVGAHMPKPLVTTTDAAGAYRFPKVVPGTYDVFAKMAGFQTATVPKVEVRLGQIKKVELVMQMGVAETITITDEAPLIDLQQPATTASIRDEMIDKLPRGRNFTSVVTQAANANDEDDLLGGISIDGASGAENRYIVDGIDTTNLQTGRAAKEVVTDFIDEVQVKLSGYAAEYGGATGGVINVITKSGSASYRGDIGGYLGFDNMNGGERPTLRLDPNDDSVAEYITYEKDDWSRFEPGMSLGGPVVKDRAWFYASYIPQLITTGRTVTFLSTEETETFERQERNHYATGNVSGQISDTLRGKFAMNFSPYTRVGTLPAQDGTGNPNVAYEQLDQSQPNAAYSGNIDYSATNHLFFSGRAGYFGYDTKDKGVPNEIWRQFITSNSQYTDIPPSLQGPGGTRNILTNSASSYDEQTRTNVTFDTSYFTSFWGDHSLKAGIQYDRIGNNVFAGYQQPRYLFYWGRTYSFLDGRRDTGEYGYLRALQIVTTGDVHSDNVGLFVQDSWSVTDKLTLNLGIRTESEKIPSFDTSAGQAPDAIDFGFGDKLAPRVGFAMDVKGDGRWKAYGQWGVYYDIAKIEMARGLFGGDKWVDYFYALDSFDWPNIGGANCPPDCGLPFFESIDRRHPANAVGEETIDPDLKPMRSQEYVLGMQHELSKEMGIGVRYVHKTLDRTIEDVGVVVPGAELFYIANPGEGIAQYPKGTDFPQQPQAERNYHGLEFDFTKRFADRWSVHASYVYSRLEGNYSGLASSDEDGRASPNVNRFFDSLALSFDQNGNAVFGKLGTDRPHQLKWQALYDFDFGTSIGFNGYIGSGTPVSRIVNIPPGLPVFYIGRESDGRTPTISQFDLYLQQEFRFENNTAMQLSLNVLNLFDQQTAIDIYDVENLEDIATSEDEYLRGVDIQQIIRDNNVRTDPRFLQAEQFQAARSLRLGLKYIF